MGYRPTSQEILRKFVLRKCIEHLIVTSDVAVWFNLTFWENVTNKAYASKCWDKLAKTIVRKFPGFRLVGVWARQRRGAWHIHAVCNQTFDIEWLRSKAMRCGFGPQFYLKRVQDDALTPVKLARYIAGYATDKNGLDPERDKGVRRMIFCGNHVRVLDMRYRSQLKVITSAGREISAEIEADERSGMTEFEREFSMQSGRKKSWETWGEWYKRNRDVWWSIGWNSLSDEEQQEVLECDEMVRRYLDTGQWSFI